MRFSPGASGLEFRQMHSGSGPLDHLGPGPAAGLNLRIDRRQRMDKRRRVARREETVCSGQQHPLLSLPIFFSSSEKVELPSLNPFCFSSTCLPWTPLLNYWLQE